MASFKKREYMRILVTGSEGYLGIPLTKVLVEYGHDVVGLDTGYYRPAWFTNDVKRLPPVMNKDVRKVTTADLMGFDAVVHLAELSNDPLGQLNQSVTVDVNHKGTVHLAKTAKRAEVSRFVYFSSCSVYGASDELLTEESAVNPLTAYAECKVLNEKALLELADEAFTPTILRNATAFGPSPRMRFDLVINNLAGLAFTTKKIKMESDGTPWRPFVHILDIAEAVVHVLRAPKELVQGEILNVGNSNSNYQIKDIARIVSEVFPDCRITLNPDGVDKRNYRVSFDKIHRILPGYRSKRDVKLGIVELKKVFERTHLTHEMFPPRHFNRLKQMSYLKKSGKLTRSLYWRARS